MKGLIAGRNVHVFALALILGSVVLASLVGLPQGVGSRQLSAEFSRAVSVYPGTEVRVLGVKVGQVTRVVPAGDRVRVDMEYDDQVKLPADAKAVVITPTLVADRFVQITPAYTEGAVLADKAVLELPDTAVPVELDRIYASLRDLSLTLGPKGANQNGALNNLLQASAGSLQGQGAKANQTLINLAAAAQTFGQGSGDLFATVTQLAEFTSVLATNDQLVNAFIADLAGISSTLAAERRTIRQAVAALARAVTTVKDFVGGNRAAIVTTVNQLTRVVGTMASEKDSLGQALTSGPLGLGNLALAYDSKSATIGSRISINNNVASLDTFLCAVVQQGDLPAASKELACRLFSLLRPVTSQAEPGQDPGQQTPDPTGQQPDQGPLPDAGGLPEVPTPSLPGSGLPDAELPDAELPDAELPGVELPDSAPAPEVGPAPVDPDLSDLLGGVS